MSFINRLASNQRLNRIARGFVKRLPHTARMLFLDVVRNGIIRKPPFSGVYARFEDVPANYPSEESRWAFAKAGLSLNREEAAGLPILRRSHSLLPLAVAMLENGGKPLRILDFGGSGGIDYLGIKESTAAEIDYHIVDIPAICAAGRKLWPNDPHISFSAELPEDGVFDIVYSWSAIHYVPDPLGFLAHFTRYNPKVILIVHSPFANRAFVRAETHGDAHYPQWVICLPEAQRVMRENGYRLAMQATDEFSYNVDNYEPADRVPHMAILLFVPEKDSSGG